MKKIIRSIREIDDIENWVVNEAKKKGLRSIKLALHHDSGWPDRLFLIPGGKPLFVEFKKPGVDNADPLQERRHEILKTLGYHVEVHNDRERALRSILAAVEAACWTA